EALVELTGALSCGTHALLEGGRGVDKLLRSGGELTGTADEEPGLGPGLTGGATGVDEVRAGCRRRRGRTRDLISRRPGPGDIHARRGGEHRARDERNQKKQYRQNPTPAGGWCFGGGDNSRHTYEM